MWRPRDELSRLESFIIILRDQTNNHIANYKEEEKDLEKLVEVEADNGFTENR